MDIGCEKGGKRVEDESNVSDLSNWKMDLLLTDSMEDIVLRSDFQREVVSKQLDNQIWGSLWTEI